MSRELKVYTELHSLFDYRRGLIQWLITDDTDEDELRRSKADNLWDLHFARSYKERRMDRYGYPALELTEEKFADALTNVTLTNFLMYYPTNFAKMFMQEIIKVEAMGDTPLEFTGVNLYVNTFPYQFDQETLNLLQESLSSRFRGRYSVSLINQNPKQLTSRFYSQFQHVFKYDIMLGDYEWFIKSLQSDPIPDTSFYVPDLFLKENKDIKGLPKDIIFSLGITLAPSLRLIPVDHALYDYEEA